MARVYSVALKGEEERQRVLSGEVAPTIFGSPEPWMAKLYEAWRFDTKGEHKAAAALRGLALDEAPATSGTIDGKSFEWIGDADSRLGPALEAIVNGRYFWLPFQRLSAIAIDPPADLRDQVWLPVRFTLTNGGETVGLIPTRYFRSQESKDPMIRLARKTEWAEIAPESFEGRGQRMLATDEGEYSLMDARQIRLNPAESGMPNG